MRRVLAAALLSVSVAVLLWPALGESYRVRGYRMRVYGCTDTRSTLAPDTDERAQIRLLNLGSQTVLIGGSVGDHVSGLTGWPLHAASQLQQAHALTLEGGGQIDCVLLNVPTPSTSHVGVIETIKYRD